MIQSYTYLLINFFTVIICLVYSFHPRIKFNRHFGAYAKAALVVAVPFILWDAWFTRVGVWWFADQYTVGLRLLGLPLEEWLFFFCIPFSCVFTYYCLNKFFNLQWANRFNALLVLSSVAVCLGVALVFHQRLYPTVTALFAAGTLLYLHYVARAAWIGQASWVFFLLMPGFFAVNGLLTGTGLASPVVNYNPAEILNVRMLTIPVEDAVYGYAQFLLVVYFFTLFSKADRYENKPQNRTSRLGGTGSPAAVAVQHQA